MRNLPILIVDDQPDQISLMSRVIALQDFTSHGATSVEQALELMKERQFGAVLLDLGMPGYEGTEAISALQAAQPSVPIIVVSGRPAEEFASACAFAGSQAYIEKGTEDPNSQRTTNIKVMEA